MWVNLKFIELQWTPLSTWHMNWLSLYVNGTKHPTHICTISLIFLHCEEFFILFIAIIYFRQFYVVL